MIISQTLPSATLTEVDKKKAMTAIRKVKSENKDISAIINAAVRAKKPKTAKARRKAREKAILAAEKRNPAFRTAILAALTRLVGR